MLTIIIACKTWKSVKEYWEEVTTTIEMPRLDKRKLTKPISA